MTLSRRSTIKAIGVIGAGATLSGTALAVSEHEDDERDPEEMPEDEDVGALRVGHFSPDAPNVDVLIDGEQILADVAYDELSPYLEVAPGTYTVTITAAGDPEAVVYEESVSVDAEYYTAAAIGELEGDENGDETALDENGNGYENGDETALDENGNGYENGDEYDDEVSDCETGNGYDDEPNGDEYDGADDETAAETEPADDADEMDEPLETGTFDVLLLVDASPDDVEEGTSQVRVVHASPDAPTVDVRNAADGAPLFEDVSFGEPSGYLPLEPGSYTVDIAPAEADDAEADETGVDDAGVDDTEADETEAADTATDEDGVDDAEQTDAVASADLELEENTAYTAYAIGYLEDAAADADEPVTDEEDGLAAEDEMGDDDEMSTDDTEMDDDEMGEDDEVGEDERPFTVRVAVDGMMADDEPELEEDVGVDDEPDDEPGVDDEPDLEDEADEPVDDTEPTDESAEDDMTDDASDEPVAADD
ncbi:DUF4397 domain-containing protein [Natronorubrum sulfidifaciens]|uniref:DUF4397 domain-containing protein n=1 Tax=Natronorubrum sulfidifaciens JCM 14089 TaxID=1230460 RepID=L9W4D6_9EURY|nr:DUF4397 domain-containing protein [Natronorubrum sulfidifaciens]ELY44320.1 hypothetical protein C495_10474 [Natronorubrum sulfidifaciens JCM 14089]